MKVVPYDPKYKQAFIDMNMAWIKAMFTVEEGDRETFSHVDDIIADGGQIFFTLDEDDNPIACCEIRPREKGVYEIEKFAASGMYTGKGAGSAALKACIDYAKEKGADKIILVSNHKCTHALGLYRKFGFVEVPVDKKEFGFDRGDIAFEMKLK